MLVKALIQRHLRVVYFLHKSVFAELALHSAFKNKRRFLFHPTWSCPSVPAHLGEVFS